MTRTRRNYTRQDRRRERFVAIGMLIVWALITALAVFALVQLNEILITF